MKKLSNDNLKPVFDVTKPENVVADQTGKPVITNNQPLQKDPMMTEKPKAAAPAELPDISSEPQSSPKVEDGTLHNISTESHLFGEIQHKKFNILRTIFLGIGFMLTIAGIVYYFLVFIKK